jgi:hypothetical protein
MLRAEQHCNRTLMGSAILGFMMQVRNKNLKAKASLFNKLRMGVKVFKGLAMNSLS